MVSLVTFLLLLDSVPLIFANHRHKEPSCNWSEDDAGEKKSSSYKLLKKRTRKTSVSSEGDDPCPIIVQ